MHHSKARQRTTTSFQDQPGALPSSPACPCDATGLPAHDCEKENGNETVPSSVLSGFLLPTLAHDSGQSHRAKLDPRPRTERDENRARETRGEAWATERWLAVHANCARGTFPPTTPLADQPASSRRLVAVTEGGWCGRQTGKGLWPGWLGARTAKFHLAIIGVPDCRVPAGARAPARRRAGSLACPLFPPPRGRPYRPTAEPHGRIHGGMIPQDTWNPARTDCHRHTSMEPTGVYTAKPTRLIFFCWR